MPKSNQMKSTLSMIHLNSGDINGCHFAPNLFQINNLENLVNSISMKMHENDFQIASKSQLS